MTREQRILEVLLAITNISNNNRLPFEEKLHKVLLEVVNCLQVKRGSIMLLKGRKALEVAASTNPAVVGMKQLLDQESPSGWVVKNKAPFSSGRYHFAALRASCGQHIPLPKVSGGRSGGRASAIVSL